jgi:hypothetical protein
VASIDPSIPLAAANIQWAPSAQQLMSIYQFPGQLQTAQLQRQSMLQEMEMRRQQVIQQNALRGILSNPASYNQQGGITPNALMALTARDPKLGMQFGEANALNQERQAAQQQRKMKRFMELMDMSQGELDKAVMATNEARNRGLPEEASIAAGQKLYSEYYDHITKSGVLSDEEIKNIPTNFDPNRVSDTILKYRNLLQQEKDKKAHEKMEQDRLDIERKRLSLSESTTSERISEARQRLSNSDRTYLKERWKVENPQLAAGVPPTQAKDERPYEQWEKEHVVSKEQVDRLPPGTLFIWDRDGQVYIKTADPKQ